MLERKPNLWKEIIDPKTGESSITEFEPKLIFECSEHYWIQTGNRELTCKHCKCMTYWHVAKYVLKDGKLIPRS